MRYTDEVCLIDGEIKQKFNQIKHSKVKNIQKRYLGEINFCKDYY